MPVKDSNKNGSAKAKKATDKAAATDDDKHFVMDIRVFLATITIVMALSFGVGVALGPAPASTSAMAPASATSEERQLHMTSRVHSGENGPDHEPAGQHLLVDIKGIEHDFLDSESRLSTAMVDTVKAAGLTMLSYHCHSLVPKGVSCVGVLLESHISFHTWPDEGVITLDLFTCGANPLVPVVPKIKELFGIQREGDEIQVQWSHELRGFRRGKIAGREENFAMLDHNSDLSQIVWSPLDCLVKEQLVSKLTDHQRVDIWDIVGSEDSPSYDDAVKHQLEPGDKRWTSPEIVSPDRYLFLDGVMQSDSASGREYHEALVHPAMFSHENPKHVGIIGGGEGATLKEVLKHNTLEMATMIEIDGELVDLMKEYFPQFSDCSDMIDRAGDCYQDKRANLVLEDAEEWFSQRFGPNPTVTKPADPFDVIIMDAIEPEVSADISKGLYINSTIATIVRSLSHDGILSIQIGRAPGINDPRPDIGINANREKLFRALEAMPEIQAMFVYEDAHCGFLEPRAFLVACRDVSCRSRWYANADVMDYEIYERVVRTHSGGRALAYFDGVTHLTYQVAPKAWETVYCRREPMPFECDYRHLPLDAKLFEYDIENEENGSFKVEGKWSEDGEDVVETYVYATEFIPKGSFIMPSHLASSLILSNETISGLRRNLGYGSVSIIEDFVDFIDEFGHESHAAGSATHLVEVGASYLIRTVDDPAEANIGRWMPANRADRPKYSPVYERHRLSFDVFIVATKDIPKGGEVLKYSGMWQDSTIPVPKAQ